jgi:hypothetical protein
VSSADAGGVDGGDLPTGYRALTLAIRSRDDGVLGVGAAGGEEALVQEVGVLVAVTELCLSCMIRQSGFDAVASEFC